MRKILLIFLLTVGVVKASAQEEVLLTRQAEAYFQAGEYDKSIELYQKLEDEKLLPWQHARIIYNIGTNSLEQNNSEALSEFATIPYSPKTAPLLSKALKINIATLKYREASLLTENADPSLTNLRTAFYLYREALQNIEEAEDTNCLLQTYMGKDYCQPSEDLTDLRSAVKRKLAMVTKSFGEAKIADSPAKEGIPFLLSGVRIALSHIEFLESKKLNDKLKKRYLKLYTRDAESWLSLWDTQMEQIAELEKAQHQYVAAIKLMKRNHLSESRIAFLDAAASLSELLQELWGIDPLLELLQRLLTSYQHTLDQVPIQTPTLYQLQIEQKQVREIMETSDASIQELNLSEEYLIKSLKFTKQGKTKKARFFLEEARQWLRRLLRQQSLPEDVPPDRILEESIQEQVHALTLNHLRQEMSGDKKEAEEVLRKSQKITLRTVEPFISAVLSKERSEFPDSPQCKPWDKVIPLFNKGLQKAKRASETIESNIPPIMAAPLQEETVKHWKEALERMRKPEEEEEKPPEEKKEETPPEEPPPPQSEETSTQDVLRLLQKMDQEDRQPRPQEMVPQKGLRPW